MKLGLFSTIDDTIAILNANKEEYESIKKELKYTLLSFLDREQALDITSRIKTASSLKEKIIRNQYYLKYDQPQEILDNLSDLIGLKIDCRFIEEEAQLYKALQEEFTVPLEEEGYYSSEKFPHIALKLNTPQPQKQRNGFTIYRVDGYYETQTHKVRFELQIKSLVNSLWGDIEHRLVYKNSSYVIYDAMMKDLLASIKANLEVIDQQLHIVYDSMGSDNQLSSGFVDVISFERLMSKAINDLCAEKLREAFGFTINIRDTSDILGHYIFKKNIQNAPADDQISNLLELFGKLNSEEIDFENEIEMELNLQSNCPFISLLGNRLLLEMNEDFDWFVFFKILFAIEPGNNIEDFILFLNVLKSYLIDEDSFNKSFSKLKEHDADLIRDSCLTMFASALCNIGDIQIVHNSKIEATKKCFADFISELEDRVIDYSDFQHYETSYSEELEEMIKVLFK